MKLKNELWDDLSLMTMDAEYSDYAVILYEAQPYALSKDILIIETDYKRNANYVNIKENHKIFSRLISKLLKREIPVYALSSEESLTITKKYRSLSQLHQLPKVQSIKNELEGKF